MCHVFTDPAPFCPVDGDLQSEDGRPDALQPTRRPAECHQRKRARWLWLRLTFAVNLGIEKTGTIGSAGEYNWGGAAGAAFWIDPKEQMIGVFLVQVMPQLTTKDQFKQLAYQSIIGN